MKFFSIICIVLFLDFFLPILIQFYLYKHTLFWKETCSHWINPSSHCSAALLNTRRQYPLEPWYFIRKRLYTSIFSIRGTLQQLRWIQVQSSLASNANGGRPELNLVIYSAEACTARNSITGVVKANRDGWPSKLIARFDVDVTYGNLFWLRGRRRDDKPFGDLFDGYLSSLNGVCWVVMLSGMNLLTDQCKVTFRVFFS